MYKQKPSNKSKSLPLFKRPVVLILLALLILGAAVGGVLAYRHFNSQPDTITERPRNTVNYDPPTDEEKRETEEFKKQQQSDKDQQPPATTTDGRRVVTPVISYAGQYDASIEASAFVSGIIEEGGTCTLTLKNGSKTVTKTSAGATDAKTTRCTLFMFPTKELSAGTWTATVSYESVAAKGTSDPFKFEVN